MKDLPVRKPNLDKMHIFGTTCFCYVQNKTKFEPRGEKVIFIGYHKQIPAYLIYFLEITVIKKVGWVKFTNYYDNNSGNWMKIPNFRTT